MCGSFLLDGLVQTPVQRGLGQLHVVLVDVKGVFLGRKGVRGRHTCSAQAVETQCAPGSPPAG